ncbi:MAG: metal-sensing transcriptional repressor [Epsilonproteobacteria bacterium]|nr:metal-sensing transcriptional repressor [Campylobacterota bacterium]
MRDCSVENKKLINRVNRIEGQLRALKAKLKEEEDCGKKDPYEVIRQLSAIKGAINGMINSYIEHYAKEHIIKEIKEAPSYEDALVSIDSLLEVIKTFGK